MRVSDQWDTLPGTVREALLRAFAAFESAAPAAASELVRNPEETFPAEAPAGVGALLRAIAVAAYGTGTLVLLPADLRQGELETRAALVPCSVDALLSVIRWWDERSGPGR